MDQVFHIFWQVVSCWFMLLLLYLSLLDICDVFYQPYDSNQMSLWDRDAQLFMFDPLKLLEVETVFP